MYICNDCKELFNITKQEVINQVEYYRELADVCPCCGGHDFEEAQFCIKCNEYYSYDNFYGEKGFYHGDICINCIEDIYSPEKALLYIKERKLEKEFYAEYMTKSEVKNASKELIDICKKEFINDLDNPIISKYIQEELKQFVFDDVEDFEQWIEESLKENILEVAM